MLRVPEDLEAQCGERSVRVAEACVVAYKAVSTVLSEPVLVTQPTFVMVCSGVKQLQPQREQHLLTVPAGSILAMRSGTHLMSEFQGEGKGYQSLIFSVDRTFLRRAVGVPERSTQGPRVAVTVPTKRVHQLFVELPEVLRAVQPDIERQFKLRELLVGLMSDSEVRQLVFREVSDWGSTTEERIVSVVMTHCLTPLQVPDLAALCAMSLSSFKRYFQGVYGQAPGKWLARMRLDHARSMVLNSSSSVTEICEASGYRDVSSFTRAFRREFGATPTSLRRQR